MKYSHGKLVGGGFTKGSDPAWDWAKCGGGYDQNRDFFSVHWEVQERDPANIRLHVEAPTSSEDSLLSSIKQQVIEAILAYDIATVAHQAGWIYKRGARVSTAAIHKHKSTEAFRVRLGHEQRKLTSEGDIETVNEAIGQHIGLILEQFREHLGRVF